MSDQQSHPLLAQVPLTVSPFVSLPTATTLPYTYKTLPSTLPLSSTGPAPNTASSANSTHTPSGAAKPKFVVSSSGHTAHPDDIIKSCQALRTHLDQLLKGAKQTIEAWENDIKERELAEKRRVAPGWLDSDEKMLQPEKKTVVDEAPVQPLTAPISLLDAAEPEQKRNEDAAGEELDRAFGGMNIRNSG